MIPYRLACGSSFLYADPDRALDRNYPDGDRVIQNIIWAAREGFSGIEIGSNTLAHFTRTFDRGFTARVTEALTGNSIQLVQLEAEFLVPAVASAAPGTASRRLDRVFEMASALPCNVISVSASLIPEFVAPHGFMYPGGPPSRIDIPNGFSWSEIWSRYVDVISLIVDKADSHGMKVALEARPREMVSTTDGLLNLFQAVGSANLGVLVNTAYLFAQREYIPLALRKLWGRVLGTHISDCDGLLEHRWAPGEGKIDWQEAIKSFRSIGYDGFLTLDAGVLGDPKSDFRQGKSFLERIMMTMS